MRRRILLGVATIAGMGAMAACGSDNSTTNTTPPVIYKSTLTGAAEVPAKAVSGTGSATYTLDGNILSYTVSVDGLTGPATASHIHGPATTAASSGVLVGFVTASVSSGTVASGAIDLSQPVSNGTTSISGDSLRFLLNNGLLYTNVHTATNGSGEIRGQIIKQ